MADGLAIVVSLRPMTTLSNAETWLCAKQHMSITEGVAMCTNTGTDDVCMGTNSLHCRQHPMTVMRPLPLSKTSSSFGLYSAGK